MIDYDATLKQFFEEVIKYLTKLSTKARDKIEQKQTLDAIKTVKMIQANPGKYVKEDMVDLVHAFIPAGSNDNSAFLAFNNVIWSMGDLDDEFEYTRGEAQKKLMRAMKTMKYKNSTSLLKDFTYAFMTPEHFAVKVKAQNEK